ncbi:MAG: periplasmic heavy metal sensor [Sphingopyxis sp.]|nr:periplasmic heavy metal sensor [Sphingopyxis sp.]
MSLMRSMILTLVLAILGAAMGAWGGSQYVLRQMRPEQPLHVLVHERLSLSPEQERSIADIEREHRARCDALQAEMRAANAELAQAFQESHAYTPRVQAAIDRAHVAMAALQQETMVHILAMRAVLTPQQATVFDATVISSLTVERR